MLIKINKENDKKLEKTDLNRVVMFNPSIINHFSFEIGNVRIRFMKKMNLMIKKIIMRIRI